MLHLVWVCDWLSIIMSTYISTTISTHSCSSIGSSFKYSNKKKNQISSRISIKDFLLVYPCCVQRENKNVSIAQRQNSNVCFGIVKDFEFQNILFSILLFVSDNFVYYIFLFGYETEISKYLGYSTILSSNSSFYRIHTICQPS